MSRRFRVSAWFPCALGAFLAITSACAEHKSPPSALLRDSAGIQVLEVPVDDAARWTVAPAPIVELGAGDATNGGFFHVTDGAFLSDGAIAVINAGSYEVKVFTPDGTMQRTFGRRGEGPGEFTAPFRLIEIPDQGLVVHDIWRGTLSLFDSSGTLLSTALLPQLAVWSTVHGWLQADRVLLGYWTVAPDPAEFRAQVTQYLAYSWKSGATDSVARVTAGSIGFIGGGEPWGRVGGALFEPAAHAATLDGLAVVGDGAVPELRFLDSAGALQRIIRWNAAPRPVRPEHLDAFREAFLAEMPDPGERAMMVRQLDATPVARTFPAFADLKVDHDGRLWLQTYADPLASSQEWYVMDAQGDLVAELTMPLSWQLLAAASDTLLVVERDELEVEHVRLYEIIR